MSDSTPTGPACPQCSRIVEPDWIVCPACLSKLPVHATSLTADVPTRSLSFGSGEGSPSSVEEGRFPAGTVLAARYRVLGLLGRGGMGEVYKAFDLILNQVVALKFLSRTEFNEAALARFRNEVRIARQVSHPNVCRVYDIGFVDGLHFLSMEYLDGEDLASLIRRIGRLPADKAAEFTRKICAGLGAAHDRGVLHRDLKPGNIMIDGRGQVRITDFGLAAIAEEIALGDIRSGTPAYMSPEQKSGKEVTRRSDIYSLGLVIHEMFTGTRPDASRSSASDFNTELDPAVERLIARCLDEDPRRRPQTALNVAMSLPGADPIAAALARGETPSPEMVAASQEKESLAPPVAVACFVVTLLGVVALLILGPQMHPLDATLELPPDVLAFQAQTLLEEFGYSEAPADEAYGFAKINVGYESSVIERLSHREAIALLRTHQPAVVSFWYRQSGLPLVVGVGPVTYSDPANDQAGMVRLRLDATGRLVQLEAQAGPGGATVGDDDDRVDLLFDAAGLDPMRFTPVEPGGPPQLPFDARRSFTGTFDPTGEAGSRLAGPEQVRVDMAFWQGRPVYFNLTGDWASSDAANIPTAVLVVGLATFLVIVVGAVGLGWYNLRSGRGDRKGARWVATFVFVSLAVSLSLLSGSISALLQSASIASLAALFMGALYLAIEPLVRRNWPDALISLTRLQAGRLRDGLVASHVLIAMTFFAVIKLLEAGPMTGLVPLDAFSPGIVLGPIGPFLGNMGLSTVVAAFLTLGSCLIIVLLRMILLPVVGKHRLWLADFAAAVILTVFLGGVSVATFPVGVATYLTALWLIRRFGLLAWALSLMIYLAVLDLPQILDSFWGDRVILAYSVPIALSAWALWVVLTDQRGRLREPAMENLPTSG